jgi:hypothetical protein
MSLVCPSCGRAHVDEARFCRDCGVPLVVEGGPAEADVTERQERMRKIKPQYSEGDLVRVAVGRQQPEAELIQNILLEEGVPSTLRRTRGFDVPEMLAAGPRDILVPQSGAEAAREVLLQADLADRPSSGGLVPPGRVLAWLLGAVVVVGALVLVIDLVSR